MSEQSRPLARRDPLKRDTDTHTPPSPHASATPSDDHLTLTILGVVLFAILVVVLVARTLYSTGP